MIASNLQNYTATHPVETSERLVEDWKETDEIPYFPTYALPVKIGDNVWIGGCVIISPGVIISKNSVIGAGSVVTRSIPENSVAFVSPCKVIRKTVLNLTRPIIEMNNIKAVIFDLDGTLNNTLPLCITAFRKSIEPLINQTLSDEDIIATFGPSEEGTIMALVPEHFEKGVSSYLEFYKELHIMCPVPFDGIEDLLIALKNKSVRIAMVTGKGKHSTEISLEQFGITQYFEAIETGIASGPSKAEGIQSILDLFKDIDKNEVIYVGDAPSDISASKKAGVAVVAAAWAETAEFQTLKKLLPDMLFDDIKDFSDWLMSRV
ncbi:HAD-IA family hydrolase [Pedobacter jamesrossensis]|uniref:phosphoglycolate phosphatase n=1 Tax=Pedobacter jamesrossensis TaxID=1908238 RepID=A0ABV8NLY8_9SPHI